MQTKEIIARNVLRLMKQQGLSQQKLAMKAGVSQPTIYKIINAKIEESKKLPKIAKALTVSTEYLTKWHESTDEIGASDMVPGPEAIGIPLITWVQASLYEETNNIYEVGKFIDMLPVTTNYGKNSFALIVKDDLMQSPSGMSFPKGSTITVETELKAQSEDYIIAKLRDSEDVTFRQLVLDSGRIYLKSLNASYPVIEVTDEEMVILGVVKQVIINLFRD